MSVFIEKITIKNLLSFDEEGITDFELKPLNVLIGANASGKSNFVNLLQLLCASAVGLPEHVATHFRRPTEMIWRADSKNIGKLAIQMRKMERPFPISFNKLGPSDRNWFVFEQTIRASDRAFNVSSERLDRFSWRKTIEPLTYLQRLDDSIEYRLGRVGDGEENVAKARATDLKSTLIEDENLEMNQSVLQRFTRRRETPVLANMARYFTQCYDEGFHLSINTSEPRNLAESDQPKRALLNDGHNLLNVFNRLDIEGVIDKDILPSLAELYGDFLRFKTDVHPTGFNLFFQEKGLDRPMSIQRMSEGTLRLLILLIILKNPECPPLICIEEPEVGFHPDVIPILAKALIEASERTQIIVTTHSRELVKFFDPEHIVTCQRNENGGTVLNRPADEQDLTEWLKDYNMGDLWRKGVIGGTRYLWKR